jgi:hypothetical protein
MATHRGSHQGNARTASELSRAQVVSPLPARGERERALIYSSNVCPAGLRAIQRNPYYGPRTFSLDPAERVRSQAAPLLRGIDIASSYLVGVPRLRSQNVPRQLEI